MPCKLPRHLDRTPVLSTDGCAQRTPCIEIPVQDGLALVADPYRHHRLSRRLERSTTGGDDRVEQLLRILLDGASSTRFGVDRRAALAQDLSVGGNDESLRRRRSLVDGKNVHNPVTISAGRHVDYVGAVS